MGTRALRLRVPGGCSIIRATAEGASGQPLDISTGRFYHIAHPRAMRGSGCARDAVRVAPGEGVGYSMEEDRVWLA